MTKERKIELMMAVLDSFQVCCPDNISDLIEDDLFENYGVTPPTPEEFEEFRPFLNWVLNNYDLVLPFENFIRSLSYEVYEEYHTPSTGYNTLKR